MENDFDKINDNNGLPTNEEIWYKDYHQYLEILEDWQDFSDCLSKDDESVFIDMITNCYNSYHRSINSYSFDSNKNGNNKFDKNKKSKSCLDRINSLFMALFLYQQKQLNLIKSNQRFIDSFHY